MVTSTRSRLRQQRTWSPDPEQTPSTTYSVATSTRGSPHHQRRLEQTLSSTCSVNSTARGRPHYQRHLEQTPSSATQCAQPTAPLGADTVINVAWNRLHRQRLNVLSQQHRSEQTPSSTLLGTDSIVSNSTCSVNSTARDSPRHQCRLEQTPSSTCSVNSTARGSPRHQRMCQPHRFDGRTPDESSSQQSTSSPEMTQFSSNAMCRHRIRQSPR